MNTIQNTLMSDFPKIQCPFVRKTYKVDHDQWKQYGRQLQLREPEVYLVTDEVNVGYEWVFDDPDTIAVKDGLSSMAKLRRDMFDWYYSSKIMICRD